MYFGYYSTIASVVCLYLLGIIRSSSRKAHLYWISSWNRKT